MLRTIFWIALEPRASVRGAVLSHCPSMHKYVYLSPPAQTLPHTRVRPFGPRTSSEERRERTDTALPVRRENYLASPVRSYGVTGLKPAQAPTPTAPRRFKYRNLIRKFTMRIVEAPMFY